MAILQISKIQHRSGNLVDLPQLDDAEFGWANDAKRLFIGKATPNENIEVLTSYSVISFSQVDGAVGNLNISNVTLAEGQVLTYDGTDWVNRGGDVGGLITLGDAGNVKLTGGAIGYVLQTDGTGNLSWAPKGTLVSGILDVTKATTAVVQTLSDNFFTNGSQVTIVDPQGMNQLAGNIYYANVLTSTTFGLYTGFSGNVFSGPVNSTSFNTYSYTTVSATTVSTNVITVANSSPFTVGAPVKFVGNMSTSNISNTATYFVQSKPNATSLKISTTSDANIANVVPLQTTSGLTAEVYQVGGQVVSTIGAGVTLSAAGGTNTTVQYNDSGSLQGSGAFTFNSGNGLLTLTGNANVGNLNATGVATATRFISNVATGTAPLVVSSTTQVANLSAATAGSATTAGTVTTAAQPNVTSVGTLTSLTVSGTSGPTLIGGYTQISNYSSAVGIKFLGGGAQYGIAVQPATDGTLAMTFFNAANTLVGSITQTASNVTWNGLVTGSNVTGTVSSATTASTVTTNAQPNITSVGTLTSLSVTGNVTSGNVYANSGTIGAGNVLTTVLSTGANTTAGSLTGNWTLTAGSRLQSTYADLAEYYEADQEYLPGTILMFGGDKEVTIADDITNRVAGVVSTNPAYVMNNTCPGLLTAIALQGRVPCKVTGNISKGDMLVSGGNGFAKSTQFPMIGTVIGKALQDFSGDEGVIEVAVGRY